jgi:hypothetical protein
LIGLEGKIPQFCSALEVESEHLLVGGQINGIVMGGNAEPTGRGQAAATAY